MKLEKKIPIRIQNWKILLFAPHSFSSGAPISRLAARWKRISLFRNSLFSQAAAGICICWMWAEVLVPFRSLLRCALANLKVKFFLVPRARSSFDSMSAWGGEGLWKIFSTHSHHGFRLSGKFFQLLKERGKKHHSFCSPFGTSAGRHDVVVEFCGGGKLEKSPGDVVFLLICENGK